MRDRLYVSARDYPDPRRTLVRLALAYVLAGCGADDGAHDAGPSDSGSATCLPGELRLDDGRCQPAGLPLDMPCPPGEMRLDDGRCQPAGLPPDMPCPPGEMQLEGGGCQPAGLPPDMPCPPGEMQLPGGGCEPAGVPPVSCGQGFEPDGRRGCNPILPEGPCPTGKMAVPGDTECHEVAPCAGGEYGSIPVEETTQFVNGAYAGTDSDGTRKRPWKRIQEGIDHARAGAIVAVAAGRYAEDLLIEPRRVRLWGRCPALVEVAGTGAQIATLAILDGAASRSEVRGLSITGPEIGFITTGASDVLVDRVWIHDTQSTGLHVEDSLGPTSIVVKASLIEAARTVAVGLIGSEMTMEATVVRDTQQDSDGGGLGMVTQGSAQERATLALRRSIFEQNRDIGVLILGSDATFEESVVRDTQPNSEGTDGRGLSIEYDPSTRERANVTLRASLLERNHKYGMFVSASDARVEATVVRDTRSPNDEATGAGIKIEADRAGRRATLAVRASLVENNYRRGIWVQGSDAAIEATAVRDSQPSSDGEFGHGVEVTSDPRKTLGALVIRASLVSNNHSIGVLASGAIADIEATVVRGTQASGVNEAHGCGIKAQADRTAGGRAQLSLRTSLVERNQGVGVNVLGSDATIEATVVQGTRPSSDGSAGSGVALVESPASGDRAKATLRSVLVSRNHWAGVRVAGSDAAIEATVVRSTEALSDGTGGRGVEVQPMRGRSEVTLRTSLVEQNREAGVLVFASAVTIEATVVRGTQASSSKTESYEITVQGDSTNGRAQLTLRASLIERYRYAGVRVLGSDATIETTVVRDPQPSDGWTEGPAIMSVYFASTMERATMALRGSLVDGAQNAGVLVAGSDATIEATIVQGTRPSSDGSGGDGIIVQHESEPQERSNATLRSSIVERNHNIGVLVMGSDATIEATVVRETQPSSDGWRGFGVQIQGDLDTGVLATATLRGVLVERNQGFGVTVFDADVAMVASVVRATQAGVDGTIGDGIAVRSFVLPATANITSTAVESNARAGISNFSAAVVIVSSAVECNRIDLNGEDEVEGRDFTFDGSEENRCGCGDGSNSTCTVLSANLSPPEPISPARPGA